MRLCVRAFRCSFLLYKQFFELHVQRREQGLMEARKEQKAEFAAWLDSVHNAAEDADVEEPAAKPMDVDAQQGVE